MPEVRQWLGSLGLARYADAFDENAIGWELLPDLDHDVLKDVGVRAAGDRVRILKAATALKVGIEPTGLTSPAPATERSSAAGEAERRQLTVMFVDLVDSTALSQKLDPEEFREINRDYQLAATAAIVEHGGYVAKYMGDGVLAYFGYPQAHEDDAERAARAGLELITSVLRLDISTKLAVRIGIATGAVVVGDLIGDGASQESAVVGETPHLAARLQSAAEPNTVVISSSTHALLYDLFDCADLGARRLKGFTDEQRLWRVVDERSNESRFEALHSKELTPFVGRASELNLLLDRWETAVAGEGQVVLLEGEAGIGKSRLADEFRRAIGARSHTPLRYQCSSHHTNSAFFPFVSQLQHAGNIRAQDNFDQRLDKLEMAVVDKPEREKILWLFATLLSLPTDRYPALTLEPPQLKSETIAAFCARLTALCQVAPVLVLFEDLHWIDPTSREVLDSLIEIGRQLPVLFILTRRPESDSPWGGHGFITKLRLNHLARRDGMSIIREVAGGKNLPEEITHQILAKTDGVALFVEELTKTVLESGLLREEPTRYVLDGGLPELAIPSTLRDSLMARLDRLLAVKEIAQIGACIGREFSHQLLKAVTGMPESDLQSGLAQLIDNQLIFRRGTPPDAAYAFKHALVQDAAYESLLRTRRRAIHAAILAALEADYQGNLGELVEVLAYHAQRAELWDKAVRYLRQSGGKAYAHSAGRESRAYYEQALSILETLPQNESTLEQAFEIRLELRPVLNQLGEPRRMLDRLREAESLAERLNDNRRRGQVCALVTIAHSQLGELDEALEFGTRALKIAVDLGDLKLRILATTYLELVHYYRGEYEPVIKLATGNLEALPVNWVHEFLGASAPPSVYDRSWLIQSLAQIGKFEDAARYETECLQVAEATHHPFSIGQAHRAAVMLHLLRGDWARARALSEQWIETAREGNVIIQLPWAIASSAWVLAQLGDASAALDRAREGEQLLERQAARELVVTRGWDYHALGRACLLVGQLDEARRLGDRGVECSPHQPGYAAYGFCLLGDVATHPDRFDAEDGEEQYSKALTLAELKGMRPLVAHCQLGLGKIHRGVGKHQAAEEHFNIATAAYREMDMGAWVKKAEIEIATSA